MALSRTHRVVAGVAHTRVYKKIWKYWYPLMTRGLGADELVFINWAYEEDPPMDLPLEATDEPDRCHINLYHRTATQADLSGKRVLEVSCGHGGGASYLTRTLGPASYTALDLNPAGIKFCQQRHNLPGLDFVQGDAEDLPFEDESFDVVLNVEASHCYPRFPVFLEEVKRVLRPGGYFAYADIRPCTEIPEWEAALAAAGLQQISHREINAEVLRGIDINTPKSRELVKRHLPIFLRAAGRNYIGVTGTPLYRLMQSGDISYRMYCFVKE
ncbi:phthiotriol/phenolphthiotriol dimycocerosates methyltransferase [Mycobacterium marinum]|uniref:phthiotriol/phenolphthiotriol dimycocerosates methyltransferase n=1 Tax=Mycobacterium marinum TaxID=1781 RepID=UPI000B97845E|nr:class I SAM-dependent methyltransferase [Mycobacterium marinum]MDC8982670.1 class I SAM-dependent methyltransferase [Mycobacterium marinum]MDC8993800.1 class I SAM-dependent methyltransferase [Mycobacterium marinum]MDC8999183.1 class I SAM-dependent methyltransferase [Mycobacterium marinum]MDC9012386.1 class I SAM-dependent methyltransferase [Mycobacterium marinum]MDC9016413.1 class I SAM-dependent methyltransferase [Mycobacterium marinum]